MEQQPQNSPKLRLVGLDLLRLFAVVLVLGRHMPGPSQSWPVVARLPFLVWFRGGWVGVDLFFVLSGFLVSGLLFTEYKLRGQLGVGRFYMRRGWKIYPPFFVLIAVTVAVRVLSGRPVPAASLASELLFLQSYLPGLWHHTWSLAVEEHFYVLLPLTLMFICHLNRRSPEPLRPVLTVAIIVAAAALIMRLTNWYLRPSYDHLTHLFASHLRIDSLLFGVAISYVYHFNSERCSELCLPWRRSLLVGGVLLLTLAFVLRLESTPLVYTFGLTVFYVASGMLLVGILLSEVPQHKLISLFATLGAYSYSIYLWHMPVLDWGIPLLERALDISLDFGARFVVYFVGAFSVGIAMAKLVEFPALRLRDRLFPSRSQVAIDAKPVTCPQV